MYQIEVRHDGLNKYRLIKGPDRHVVEQKAIAQRAQWDEMWARRQAQESKREERQQSHKDRERKKQEAFERTEEIQRQIDQCKCLLVHTLGVNDRINWELLKDWSTFSEPRPQAPMQPTIPPAPDKSAPLYNPQRGLLARIIPFLFAKHIEQAEVTYRLHYQRWEKLKANELSHYDNECRRYAVLLDGWQRARDLHILQQGERNAAIDAMRRRYEAQDEQAIVEYSDLVLSRSEYPDWFEVDWSLNYLKDGRLLIVDYRLPDRSVIPNVKEVKYNQSRDEFVDVQQTDSAIDQLVESAYYQIALRSIHELLEADSVNGLDAVVFNGWTSGVDRSTGQQVTACIMSVQARKSEFGAIDLAHVDPKACFKKLKGVGSAKLASLTPVAPLVSMNTHDHRFVESRPVMESASSSGVNLASMPWEDFEHLVREVFEREFSRSGGEVKVTRASRDGGVDAVAFDPDPVRGGKIVIQAKRYTRTVGVAAVRDLYGTVMNEGAMKGILVTTADYGPDAYAFASDKPLTLLNGANLLHMLELHGHKARIDIREARALGQITGEEESSD